MHYCTNCGEIDNTYCEDASTQHPYGEGYATERLYEVSCGECGSQDIEDRDSCKQGCDAPWYDGNTGFCIDCAVQFYRDDWDEMSEAIGAPYSKDRAEFLSRMPAVAKELGVTLESDNRGCMYCNLQIDGPSLKTSGTVHRYYFGQHSSRHVENGDSCILCAVKKLPTEALAESIATALDAAKAQGAREALHILRAVKGNG